MPVDNLLHYLHRQMSVYNLLHYLHGQVPGYNFLHHPVSIWYPRTSLQHNHAVRTQVQGRTITSDYLSQPQVLGKRLVWVVGVIEQLIGLLHVLWTHYAVRVFLSSQETLENKLHLSFCTFLTILTLVLSNMGDGCFFSFSWTCLRASDGSFLPEEEVDRHLLMAKAGRAVFENILLGFCKKYLI